MTRTKDEQQCLHSFMEASHEVELLNPRKPALCGSGKAFFQGNAIRVPLVKDWGLKHSRIHRMSIDFRSLSLQSPICWNNFQRLKTEMGQTDLFYGVVIVVYYYYCSAQLKVC